jgi:hypothetical protein
MTRAVRLAAGLLLWTAAVVWLTWPLAARITTHLPNTAVASPFDSLFVAWALSHESRALVTNPRTLPDGNIYHPARRALFYGEAGFGATPYFMPAFLLTGNPILALNVVFLTGLVLTAATLHLLAKRLTGSALAGVVAGATFVTTPWVLRAWVPAAPNYAVLQYFPLILLLSAHPALPLGRAAWLVALVVLQGLSSPYVAASLLAPLGLLGVVRLVRRRSRAAGGRLLAVVGIAAPILVAAYSGYLLVRLDNPQLQEQTVWPLQATSPAPWIGPFGREAPTGLTPAAFALIGAGIIARAVRRRRDGSAPRDVAWRLGAFWATAGFVLAIRPHAHWRESLLAFPQSIAAQLTPVYTMLRIPERLGIGALMGLAVLAGVAFAECTVPLARRRDGGVPRRVAATGALVLVLCALYWSAEARRPGPWTPARYGLFRPVGQDAPLLAVVRDSTGPLLELPAENVWAQAGAVYRSIYHGRPLLNGYSGYWPAGFPERMALARRLPDPSALDELSRTTGLRQILVHTASCRPEERAAWTALADAGGNQDLALVARDGADVLFATRRSSAPRARLERDPGEREGDR